MAFYRSEGCNLDAQPLKGTKSGGGGIKRPRSGHDPAILRPSSSGNRSLARDLHFTSEILADIGVCPLDDDSSDAENDAPFRRSGASATTSALDMTVFWDAEPLGPTPSDNVIPNSVMPLRALQVQNSSASTLQKKGNFQLRKRARLDSPVIERDMFCEVSDEIFLQIFQWIPKSTLKHCAQVSKRWRRISYDESLWKYLDLGGRKLRLSTLVHILQRGVTVMRLARADISSPITPDSLSSKRLFKVQYLDLSMVALSSSSLETLLSRCKCLRKLSLESCELNTKVCQYIAENKDLVELNLALCSGIDKQCLQAILSGCEKLEALNLAWTELPKECVSYAVCNFPTSLKCLNLSGCRQTIDNNDVEDLTDTCPCLEILDLSDGIKLTSPCIKLMMNSFAKLKALHLSRCYNIHPDIYRTLVDMPSLMELNVFGVMAQQGVELLREYMGRVTFNVSPFTTVARPTTGIRRTSIWTLRVRD